MRSARKDRTCADGALDCGGPCTLATQGAARGKLGVCDASAKCQEITCEPDASGPGIYTGDVLIDATDTAGDLALLSGVVCVTGDVTITRTSLTDLSGLSGLRAIGGSLSIGTFDSISGNNLLTSLVGLERLRHVGGALLILQERALLNLNGLHVHCVRLRKPEPHESRGAEEQPTVARSLSRTTPISPACRGSRT